ncbi:MAG: hypothetical protein AAGI71_00875 [Bacteroidota bacterium]
MIQRWSPALGAVLLLIAGCGPADPEVPAEPPARPLSQAPSQGPYRLDQLRMFEGRSFYDVETDAPVLAHRLYSLLGRSLERSEGHLTVFTASGSWQPDERGRYLTLYGAVRFEGMVDVESYLVVDPVRDEVWAAGWAADGSIERYDDHDWPLPGPYADYLDLKARSASPEDPPSTRQFTQRDALYFYNRLPGLGQVAPVWYDQRARQYATAPDTAGGEVAVRVAPNRQQLERSVRIGQGAQASETGYRVHLMPGARTRAVLAVVTYARAGVDPATPDRAQSLRLYEGVFTDTTAFVEITADALPTPRRLVEDALQETVPDVVDQTLRATFALSYAFEARPFRLHVTATASEALLDRCARQDAGSLSRYCEANGRFTYAWDSTAGFVPEGA